MWGAIGKALNDTIFKGSIKPLNKIIETEAYNSYYNSLLAYVSAYGDNSGAIVVVPYGTQEITGYDGNTSLKTVVIPNTVTSIAESAFKGCTSLETIILPKNINTILYTAFQNCTSLGSIYLPESISDIRLNAFSGCSNLTDIYVGWSDGDVLNAPWGASNATIHYNTEV